MVSRRRFLIVSTVAGVTACSGGNSGVNLPPAPAAGPTFGPNPTDALGTFGSNFDPADFAAAPQSLPPEAFAGTTLQGFRRHTSGAGLTVLTNLPPPSRQGIGANPNGTPIYGSPGTCEAQSYGYGLGSYTAAQYSDGTVRWSPTTSNYQVSPAWLFAYGVSINKASCPSGGQNLIYLDQLVNFGAASVQDVPYNPNNLTTPAAWCTSYLPTINATNNPPPFSDYGQFAIGSFAALPKIDPTKQSAQLALFKKYLDAGHAIAFSGLVAYGYGVTSPNLVNNVFYATGGPSSGTPGPVPGFIPGSGHGQLIVGYSDTVGGGADPALKPGAFLVQNSFGTGWNPGPTPDFGRNGRIWWSYDAFFRSQGYAAVAYSDAPPSAVRNGIPFVSSGASGVPSGAVLAAKTFDDDRNPYADPTLGKSAYLAFVCGFSKSVRVDRFTVSEPSGTNYKKTHGFFLKHGSLWVPRGDGKKFAPGVYTLVIEATVNGAAVQYTAAVPVTG